MGVGKKRTECHPCDSRYDFMQCCVITQQNFLCWIYYRKELQKCDAALKSGRFVK